MLVLNLCGSYYLLLQQTAEKIVASMAKLESTHLYDLDLVSIIIIIFLF